MYAAAAALRAAFLPHPSPRPTNPPARTSHDQTPSAGRARLSVHDATRPPRAKCKFNARCASPSDAEGASSLGPLAATRRGSWRLADGGKAAELGVAAASIGNNAAEGTTSACG